MGRPSLTKQLTEQGCLAEAFSMDGNKSRTKWEYSVIDRNRLVTMRPACVLKAWNLAIFGISAARQGPAALQAGL